MKKVVNSEEANLDSISLKKLTLKGLMALTLSTSMLLTGCGNSKEDDTQQIALNNLPTKSVETVKIDGINLLISKAIEDVQGNHIVYEAPGGFVLGPNNICYKLTVDDRMPPEGYILGADGKSIYPIDSEKAYYAPEGYILVGDKIVKVMPLEEIEDEENYDIYSWYGISIEDAPLISSLKK